MTAYQVMISAAAERDLLEIVGYITLTLKEPSAAGRLYRAIKEKILTLKQFPERHEFVRDELFARQGIRRLYVENYTVFYRIDADARIVDILRILYSRREWRCLLGE